MREKIKKTGCRLVLILCMMTGLWAAGFPAHAQEALEVHVENSRAEENRLKIYVNDTSDKAEYALTPDDFSVTLGGNRLTCTDVSRFSGTGEPVSYIFLVDVSGSISEEKLQNMKDYLKTVTEKLQAIDQVCLITLGDNLNIGEFTSGKAAIDAQIDQITGLQEDTNLYYGIVESLKLLNSRTENSGKRALLVLSDGQDDQTTGITREEVNNWLEETRIPVYTAAMLDSGADSTAQEFAKILGSFARLSAGGIHTTFGVDDVSMEESAARIAESVANSLVLTADMSGYKKGTGQAYLQVTLSVEGLGTASDGCNISEDNLKLAETEVFTETEETQADMQTETPKETQTEMPEETQTETPEETQTETPEETQTEILEETQTGAASATEKMEHEETDAAITDTETENAAATESRGGSTELPGAGTVPVIVMAAAAAALVILIIVIIVALSRKKKRSAEGAMDAAEETDSAPVYDAETGEMQEAAEEAEEQPWGKTAGQEFSAPEIPEPEPSESENLQGDGPEEKVQSKAEQPEEETGQPVWNPQEEEPEEKPEKTENRGEKQQSVQKSEEGESKSVNGAEFPDAVIYLTKIGFSEEKTYEVRIRGEVTLGRQPQSVDYAFPEDGHMSALHCSISYKNGKIILCDRNSRNGTRVNGVPITAPYELRRDDIIRIGKTELRVHW